MPNSGWQWFFGFTNKRFVVQMRIFVAVTFTCLVSFFCLLRAEESPGWIFRMFQIPELWRILRQVCTHTPQKGCKEGFKNLLSLPMNTQLHAIAVCVCILVCVCLCTGRRAPVLSVWVWFVWECGAAPGRQADPVLWRRGTRAHHRLDTHSFVSI